MHFPTSNEMVPVEDLVKLNNALRKSTVGYQTGAQADAGAALSPLVPQSIEGSLASATYTMRELALWPMIPKANVTNTLHEYVVVNEHGLDLDPFIGEGGGAESDFATNNSQYERKSVKIKYMAERRQISDVASLVGLIGDNRQAIAEETMRGTMSLLGKVEKQLWYGREALNDKGFDGICAQIEAGGTNRGPNVYDLQGRVASPLLLQEALGEVYSAPNYGRPDTIYVEPRIHSELIKQSVESGRHDQFSVSNAANGLTFGASNLSIMAPYGPVQVKAAPFLHFASRKPAAGFGAGKPGQPAIQTDTAKANSSSNFTATDAGAYKYYVVAVNDKGYSDQREFASIDVVANDVVTFTITGNAAVNYYRIYRTSADGAESTARLIKEIPANGAADITVEDKNDGADGCMYNTSKIVFAQHDPQVFEFVRLLDFLRRPLAEVATAKPFMLMLFGTPVVKTPGKMFVIKNAGIETVSAGNPQDVNWKSANF